jgi:hypothetical protein
MRKPDFPQTELGFQHHLRPGKKTRSSFVKSAPAPLRFTASREDGGRAAVAGVSPALNPKPRKKSVRAELASAAHSAGSVRAPTVRTSEVLREILTKNPTVKSFTVKQIVDSIDARRVGVALAFFSISGMAQVPGTSDLAGIPTGLVASQMIAGRTEIKLPKFILERTVPRRSLAVAIHAILPVLQLAEKAAKPRWRWASRPAAQRMLGALVLLLALAIAFPMLGFKVPHAAAIFAISVGLVEQDGVVILIGVAAGLASLLLLAGTVVSGEAFHLRPSAWAMSISTKLGVKWAAKTVVKWTAMLLKKIGLRWAMLRLLEFAEFALLREPPDVFGGAGAKKPGGRLASARQKRSVVRQTRARRAPRRRTRPRTTPGHRPKRAVP